MEKNSNLLIVDDEPPVTRSVARLFRHDDYRVFTANSAMEALTILGTTDIGVMISDISMPGVDGLSLCASVRKRKPDIVQIILTGHPTLDNAVAAINQLQLFSFMIKPWNEDALHHVVNSAFDHFNLAQENKHLQLLTEQQNRQLKDANLNLEEKVRMRTFDLEEALNEGILMLAKAAEEKDRDTGDHINRIMDLTYQLGIALKLPHEQAAHIARFSRIHDVGKIHIPDHVLNKPGPLDEEEWRLMKQHTVSGERIISELPYYVVAREIARSHHENWDGSGYPDGLVQETIPLSARIVAVVDVFDALTHDRPYKKAWSRKDALLEMNCMSGVKFDPDILRVFTTNVIPDLDYINKKSIGKRML